MKQRTTNDWLERYRYCTDNELEKEIHQYLDELSGSNFSLPSDERNLLIEFQIIIELKRKNDDKFVDLMEELDWSAQGNIYLYDFVSLVLNRILQEEQDIVDQYVHILFNVCRATKSVLRKLYEYSISDCERYTKLFGALTKIQGIEVHMAVIMESARANVEYMEWKTSHLQALSEVKEQPTVYFQTWAYNAEKTVARTIESVINQSYEHWIYYIIDNGSTDATGEIIRKYAQQDSRIRFYSAKKNKDYTTNTDFWNLPSNIPDGDYYCNIDADDYYDSLFLEKMLAFSKEYSLDIAACGCHMFDEKGRIVQRMIKKEKMVLDNPFLFDGFFPMAHWNMRQLWGKLFTAKAAKGIYCCTDLPDWFPRHNGGDTINTMNAIKNVKNFGIQDEGLHYYFLSSSGAYSTYKEGRIEGVITLDKKAHELLYSLVGQVSVENELFLNQVFYNGMWDAVKILLNSTQRDAYKMEYLKRVLALEPICRVIQRESQGGQETEIRRNWNAVINWLNGVEKELRPDALAIEKTIKNLLEIERCE